MNVWTQVLRLHGVEGLRAKAAQKACAVCPRVLQVAESLDINFGSLLVNNIIK